MVCKRALGLIPTVFIVLSTINFCYETDLKERNLNFDFIMLFLVLNVFFMYTYTCCWCEVIADYRRLSGQNRFKCLKMLFGIFISQLLIYIYYDTKELEETEQLNEMGYVYFIYTYAKWLHFQRRYNVYLMSIIELLSLQTLLICLCAFITISCLSFCLRKEKTNENYKNMLLGAMIVHSFIESLISCRICLYVILKLCFPIYRHIPTITAREIIYIVMSLFNVWSTVVDRGYYIFNQLSEQLNEESDTEDVSLNLKEELKDNKVLSSVLSSCLPDDQVVSKVVTHRCDDVVHSYCLKLIDENFICPQCQLQLGRSGDISMDEELEGQMIFKMIEKMENFDEEITFFSENGDLQKFAGTQRA